MIFVFGSNKAGKHGKGAAKYAIDHYGAVYGMGVGLQGESYAIPTKNHNLTIMRRTEIQMYVNQFIRIAELMEDQPFLVTRIGCGLSGYKDSEMATLFIHAPYNCIMPIQWESIFRHYGTIEFCGYHNEGKIIGEINL